MIHRGIGIRVGEYCIPRESGDDPKANEAVDAAKKVFPARAGMILPETAPPKTLPRIPRESGDDPTSPYKKICGFVYSPRERG